MDMARFANKYFNDQEPWRTRRENPDKCASTINLCLQASYWLSILMHPILPFSSEKIQKMLKHPGKNGALDWEDIGTKFLKTGQKVGELEILFEKIPDEKIQQEIEQMQKMQQDKTEKENKKEAVNLISIDEFKKVELKSAKILSAEKVPGADKLLKLQVELGGEKRQLVAGIAQHYKPEDLPGKTIIIVANLQPAKIRGIDSQGMLLAVNDGTTLALLTTDKTVPSGKPIS
jgi:methionyl-tRNA synthetase